MILRSHMWHLLYSYFRLVFVFLSITQVLSITDIFQRNNDVLITTGQGDRHVIFPVGQGEAKNVLLAIGPGTRVTDRVIITVGRQVATPFSFPFANNIIGFLAAGSLINYWIIWWFIIVRTNPLVSVIKKIIKKLSTRNSNI